MHSDAVLRLIVDVAAQVVVPRFRALADHEVIEKSPGDLVTIADREGEERITEALLADDPNALVVGEEAVAHNPSLLDELGHASHAWLVDPVDGTRNFVKGSPDYAVMVAEIRDGVTVRGWIWQPAHELAMTGERLGGVFVNGMPVTRPAPAPGESPPWAGRSARRVLQGGHGQVSVSHTAYCCGVDYPNLVLGVTDFLLYVHSRPWDHAAGALFVEEVGGVVQRRDGTPYDPRRRSGGPLLAAADDVVWNSAASALFPLLGDR